MGGSRVGFTREVSVISVSCVYMQFETNMTKYQHLLNLDFYVCSALPCIFKIFVI